MNKRGEVLEGLPPEFEGPSAFHGIVPSCIMAAAHCRPARPARLDKQVLLGRLKRHCTGS